ncbi:MAG: transcriptional regulator [Planctomycetia bacterium]|nr:transcriptional regulator [Planctomycetia bacterium]
MSTAPRMNKSTTEELPADMVELAGLIAALPAQHRLMIEPVLNRVTESTKRRRRILNLVQDALAQLRLDMKYLVFDLEATRRERDVARQELEEGTNRGDE